MLQLPKPTHPTKPLVSLAESYELCRRITEKYSKTFYLGTLLMPKAKRQAIWAIYVWCRRTDELVDGPQARLTTPETLDLWEKQLETVFSGVALEDADVALVDTLEKFPMDIQPFRDMIAGQQMDLYRSRYQTFDELKLYCYRVAGTRIYLPLEDLERFNYSEDDLLKGVNDHRWQALMRFQIERARYYYDSAERGIRALNPDSRWPVWAALLLYQGILDVIEANNYDVFARRAFVPLAKKMLYLPVAWLRSQAL